MKNFLMLMLCLMLVTSLIACNKTESADGTNPNTDESSTSNENTNDTSDDSPDKVDESWMTWDRYENIDTSKNGKLLTLQLTIPVNSGSIIKGGGRLNFFTLPDLSGLHFLTTSQFEEEEDWSSVTLDNMMDICDEKLSLIDDMYYGSRYEFIGFNVAEKAIETINDRDFYVINGIYTYKYEDNTKEEYYSLYVTQLSNGCHAMWMISDMSENQINKDTVDFIMYKMAESAIER